MTYDDYYGTDPYSSMDTEFLFGFLAIYFIVIGIVVAFNIIINFKLFKKAGRPGWYAFVPFFDQFNMFKMTWGTWVPYILFLFVPIVNIVIAIMNPFKIAKAFGKSTGFGVLTLFVPFVGLPILAFGSAQYIGPDGEPEYGGYNNHNNYGGYNQGYGQDPYNQGYNPQGYNPQGYNSQGYNQNPYNQGYQEQQNYGYNNDQNRYY